MTVSPDRETGALRRTLHWMRRHSVELMLILFVCLLPFEEVIHVPITVLFFMTVALLVRKQMVWQAEAREFLLIIALVIVPLTISAVWAEYTWRTMQTVLRWVAYAVAGLAVLHYFRRGYNDGLLVFGLAGILFFVCLDALFQYISGTSLFGAPLEHQGRATGVFYPRLRLGHALAHMSPFILEAIRRYVAGQPRRYWAWLLVVPVLAVMLASGGRSSWLVMMVLLPVYTLYLVYRGQMKWWIVAGIAAFAAVGLFATLQYSTDIQNRVDRTLGAFTTDIEQLNYASSNRIRVYEAAWAVVKENPVIGVGWRGFRTASENVGMPMKGIGHAHFYALDVLLHTGVIGFAGYLVLLWLLLRLCIRNARRGYDTAFAFSLGALILAMPINLHYSFYYYHSAGMFLVMMMLAYGATANAVARDASPPTQGA